jgi:hypothetical protein
MGNKKGEPIKQKIFSEVNEKIWLIKNSKGKIVDRFRTKIIAEATRRKLEKNTFEEHFLERDNSFRDKIKRQYK